MRLLTFVIIYLLLLSVTSCGKKDKKETKEVQYTEKQAKVINRVTNGKIKSDDIIEVKFINPVIERSKIESEVEKDVFDFDPSLDGKTYWKTTSTLVFKPDEPLPFRENYTGKLDLQILSEKFKKKQMAPLKFDFTVAGRRLSSFTGKMVLKNRNNPKYVNYKGTVSFTEEIDLETVEDAVQLKEDGTTYDLKWNSITENKKFSFISEDIERTDNQNNFTITFDKDDLEIKNPFTKSFILPPIGEMKVVEVNKVEEGRSPQIRVKFSDQFDPQQDLSGLVSTNEIKDIKTQKLGKTIILSGNFKYGNKYTVRIEKGLRSRWGSKTEELYTKPVTFSNISPQVEFASKGVFLPSNNQYKLQFYTSNLKRVHIQVKKVYAKSLGEFIQTERLNSLKDRHTAFKKSYINRVGVIVYNETYTISDKKNQWLLHEVDLSELITKDPKGVYLVRLNFNPQDMLVDINKDKYSYIEEAGQIYKPVMFTDIGLTCKEIDNQYVVFATDMKACKPLEGVEIKMRELYGHDKDIVARGITNSNGIAKLPETSHHNVYIEAEKNGQRSVIKFNEMQWNLSGFDVGGISEPAEGVRAYIYTERGVYRPGDSINISVIARNEDKKFPDNRPLTVDLYNPEGKKVYAQTSKQNTNGFYNFPFKTQQSDPTGNWTAKFQIGHQRFHKTIKVETIVPYRLKVNILPKQEKITWKNSMLDFTVKSRYLFGNPASNLPLKVEMGITGIDKEFSQFQEFTFTNPSYEFESIKKEIFEGKLDESGEKKITQSLPETHNVPSALNLRLRAEVQEKGGRPNIRQINIPFEPYSHYVGLQPPKYNHITTGEDVQIPVILVNSDGETVPGKSLQYKIYRNTKYWWWQYDRDSELRFKSDVHTVKVSEGALISKQTHNKINFNPIKKGSYLIEVTDETGTGHSAGIKLNAFPYGGVEAGDKNAGTLALHADKDKYYTGEEAKIQFPAPKNGLALVTVEKYDQILSKKWYRSNSKKEMTIEIPVTKKMVPNAYISVSLMQPHSNTENDRPIRMFGILPLKVEDKDTRHEISIHTASHFEPDEDFNVTVQTKNNEQTQFTIAVVDEGILDITNFETPDPWSHFFQKTRLGVKTFDLFSQVIAANKGDVFKTFSIGGGMGAREQELQPGKRKRRFKPVSLFKGPLMTNKNGKATVNFSMPNYIGSVRVMAISAKGNSYGRAEKAVPVKSELMILPTLPRVIGPEEKFTIPVSVFATQEDMGRVTVKIQTNDPLVVEGRTTQQLNFNTATDKDCFFTVSSKAVAKQGKVTIKAYADKYSAHNTVNLNIRPTSPRKYKSQSIHITPGSQKNIPIPGDGIAGTNHASLTISAFPQLNINRRLEYLIHYPYGCIEQTTSSVFPQLYLKKFMEFPDAFASEIHKNINRGIERLRRFQLSNGGFSYWPYHENISKWGSLYAGHFLVEAKARGYHIPPDLYENWLNYTKRKARHNKGGLMYRAYRSYILALAKDPVFSEMNLLRESKIDELNNTQKWLLAASYHIAGQKDNASKITKNTGIETKNFREFSGTYGSGLRNKAMILDAMVALEKYDKADQLVREISNSLQTQHWSSTQTIGYSLLAFGKYREELQEDGSETKIAGTVMLPSGKQKQFETGKSITYTINKGFGKNVEVDLDNASTVKRGYIALDWNGVPLQSDQKKSRKNIGLEVQWYDENGATIDPSRLDQGTTFWGHFSVDNSSDQQSIDEVALVQVLPSGWEIENTRLHDQTLPEWTEKLNLNHQEYTDIRDDRIMWFFDLHDEKLDFIVKLNTVTVGDFRLPACRTKAMYNNNYKAIEPGYEVEVVKP